MKHIKVPKTGKVIKANHNGHWSFSEKMDPDKYMGFIYLVRDNYLNRFYLGKKLYRGQRGKAKGVESNWKKYMSSSNLLKEMFEARPLDEFELICVEQYKTKSGLSWAETWTLCFVEAPTTEQWYNTRVEKIAWNVKEAITERHRERLHGIINGEVF
jgi:hypothetical protein